MNTLNIPRELASRPPAFALKLPKGIFKRWKARRCKHAAWMYSTGTLARCCHCQTDRKDLGVIVLRDERGVETGETKPSETLLSRQLIDYSQNGWHIPAPSPFS